MSDLRTPILAEKNPIDSLCFIGSALGFIQEAVRADDVFLSRDTGEGLSVILDSLEVAIDNTKTNMATLQQDHRSQVDALKKELADQHGQNAMLALKVNQLNKKLAALEAPEQLSA